MPKVEDDIRLNEVHINISGDFKNFINKFRKKVGYDCIVLLNNDYDTIFTLFLVKEVLKLKPLAVTFNSFWGKCDKFNVSKVLDIIDVDHLMFTPRVTVLETLKNTCANKVSYIKIGETAFLFKTALQYQIDLIFCKVNDCFNGEVKKLIEPKDISYLYDFYDKDNLLEKLISGYDKIPYNLPNPNLFSKQSIHTVNLERLILWNRKQQARFLKLKYGLKKNKQSDRDDVFWYLDPRIFKVKHDKKSKLQAKYKELVKESKKGRPLFEDKIRYCVRCCWPETSEGVEFDELGMCQSCCSSEQKMHINWSLRDKKLNEILTNYKSKDKSNYDCIVPISGGKDSIFQLYILRETKKVFPLAVTFSHNWYSETGLQNLKTAIRSFDVDHIMFNPRRSVINKLAKKSLYMIGDSCWHCHAGVGAFPLQIAAKYDIGLLIWGESNAEDHGLATYEKPILFDRDYFTKYSARYYAEEMVDKVISTNDIQPYILPTYEIMEEKSIKGIHLGDYMFWDGERQVEFVKKNFGWQEDNIEGTYKGYKSVECRMAGVHDYTKFLKRGFGRATDHVAQDVRAGLLTREEGFELAKKYDTERPKALDYYEKITGYSEEEIEKILYKKRDEKSRKLPK